MPEAGQVGEGLGDDPAVAGDEAGESAVVGVEMHTVSTSAEAHRERDLRRTA